MLRVLLELLLEDLRRLEIGSVGLVGLRAACRRGRPRRRSAPRRRPGTSRRALSYALARATWRSRSVRLREILVVRRDRLEVVALALRSSRPCARPFSIAACAAPASLRRGAGAGERVVHQDRGEAPGGDGAARCPAARPPRTSASPRCSRTSAASRPRAAASPAPRGCRNSGTAPCRALRRRPGPIRQAGRKTTMNRRALRAIWNLL